MSINLYKVTVGSSVWYYTSGEFDVALSVDTYLAVPLKRTDLSFDLSQTDITLTISSDLEPFHLFKYSVPLVPFIVEIIGYPSLITIFKGNVTNVSFDVNTKIAKVKLGSARVLEGVTCPSRTFGVTCSYELFSGSCGLSSASYKTSVAIGSIVVDGETLTSAAFGAHGEGYYTGGYIEASNGETQYIVLQSGNTLNLLGGLVLIADISTIDVYPGCNKGTSDCEGKYNNLINFGGFPWIPTKNIFSEAL